MKRLIILSVPFQRINRVLLSPPFLDAIRSEFEIAIVSPFANDPKFKLQFGDLKPILLECPPLNAKSKLMSVMYEISEILRMNGHWWLNRKRGTRYNYEASKIKFGRNGIDSKYHLIHRLIFASLSRLGAIRYSWRLIDRVIGRFLFKFPQLLELTKNYHEVVFIQSASWGTQDRLLAWLTYSLNWKLIMVPYTTDQLYCNGHLLLNYDWVCVQGMKEEYFAKHFHKVPEKKIIKLGAVWARYMELLNHQVSFRRSIRNNKKVIIYAGCSNLYFPEESEFMGLDLLVDAINSGVLKDVELVYRPLIESIEMERKIFERYKNVSFLTIQVAQKACYSLDEMSTQSQSEELTEYFLQVSRADLLVMSYATTLSIDLAFLGIPSLANFIDPTGTLKKRKTHLRFDQSGRIEGIEGIPVITEVEDYISEIKRLLYDAELAKLQTDFTTHQWDFPGANLTQMLNRALHD